MSGRVKLKRVVILVIITMGVAHTISCAHDTSYVCEATFDPLYSTRKKKKQIRTPYVCPLLYTGLQNIIWTAKDLAWDAVAINLGLVQWQSFKILATVFPFFIASRMVDERLQGCFYRRCHHRNVNQLPGWCHEAIRYGIGIPIAFLGLQGLLSRDQELFETARIFLIGMPFVIFGKDLLKKIHSDACLRPWNQKFDCKVRAYGGFPSGHMAEASYMAFLYGLRFGPSYGIPLGILSVLLGAIFLNCNRHYLSQLVAGVGLGAMYAVSAYTLIDKKLGDLAVTVSFNKKCDPSLCLSYNF